MRLATWNVNSLKARIDRVVAWLDDVSPDVLCIQETKLAQDKFPHDLFVQLGYESIHYGQGQWNGVAILSKVGIESPRYGLTNDPSGEARAIWATCQGVRVASLYIPNGRSLEDDHYQYKLRWLEALLSDSRLESEQYEAVVLGGDFNVAPSDLDLWDISAFDGMTHVSPLERKAIEAIIEAGFVDLFRQMYKDSGLYSWWDYRNGAFHKKNGMRIDLVLGSQKVSRDMVWALIDRNERKGGQSQARPSDHAPLVIEFDH
ncbi:exodeoxyribonuclease III [Acidithrix ferrooxidans]|uniref:Exodeoxyribonuclease n=1 Tax=Acidithrix ferrooxidans TaxID=1280514 RepID=A0A0D8HGW4_9ACTN|nr:exodeoxyribonuclease III [Acidithrix ferrooxidans]KJF17007.1 exodeoxyribonuclease [Acidithrix ferrooxidans]